MPCDVQLVHHLVDVELLAQRHLVVRLGHADRRAAPRPGRRGRTRVWWMLRRLVLRARLEDRPQPAVGVAQANGRDRLAHGGRVVREVVDHQHAADLAADLLPALHAAERREARRGSGRRSGRARAPARTRRWRSPRCGGPTSGSRNSPASPARLADHEPRALGPEAEVLRGVVGLAVRGVGGDERPAMPAARWPPRSGTTPRRRESRPPAAIAANFSYADS